MAEAAAERGPAVAIVEKNDGVPVLPHQPKIMSNSSFSPSRLFSLRSFSINVVFRDALLSSYLWDGSDDVTARSHD